MVEDAVDFADSYSRTSRLSVNLSKMEAKTRNGTSHSEAGKLGFEKSKQTLALLKQQRITEYNVDPVCCKQCGQSIPYLERVKIFCSTSCSATFYNAKRKVSVFCLGCSSPIIGDSQRKFCSIKCQKSAIRRENIQKWKDGKDSGWNGKTVQLKSWLRDFLIKESGSKCSLCNWGTQNPFTKTVPLQIHHKDGDAKNCDSENLQVICPNCHALTSNFGRRNKVSSRKERYA